MFSGSLYALLAGFLGAAASLSAKLSLGSDYLKEMCESGLRDGTETDGGSPVCDWLHIPLRLLCGGLLFTCNAVMWAFFSKALHYSSSSARATVTTTASNFISSVSRLQSPSICPFAVTNNSHSDNKHLHLLCLQGVLGRLIFGETHMALWWAGISLTLCGLLVLHNAAPHARPQDDGKKDK
ncbi:transmembrane protein 42-like isoform X2 [Melanotaenia boesemani]|uniref:transmembrane protein 42-like isoform X2 n=1 Tax=Melanotaenia boesemani TaxID=1250792 RepID=UPI001C0547AE|nr:transmembrane protein 42-like isoform X2 [Melanotaenia boesemani]